MCVVFGRNAESEDAAVLACKDGTCRGTRVRRSWAMSPGRVWGVVCGDPRLDRSIQGALFRLPGGGVLSAHPPRRRCSRAWKCGDNVDIVPPVQTVEGGYIPIKGGCQWLAANRIANAPMH